MTGTPAAQPDRNDLTVRIFRSLYAEYDLRTVGGMHVVVPCGTPWFAGNSLGEIARQISECEYPEPEQDCGPANLEKRSALGASARRQPRRRQVARRPRGSGGADGRFGC